MGAETEVKYLGVAIDGGEQVLHVGRPPRQLAPAAGTAAHLVHINFIKMGRVDSDQRQFTHLWIVLALVAQGMSLLALIYPATL